jgi:hypothetical protein
MALQELNGEAIIPTAQALLSYLDREDIHVPGNLVEAIVSGKSLLRALAQGQLVLAQHVNESQVVADGPLQEAEDAA